MKKILNLSLTLLVAGASLLSSCSDEFLKEKRNYGNYVASDIYNDYSTAKLRVGTLYNYMLPRANQSVNWRFPSAGVADDFSKSTEEYGGFSIFTDPNTIVDYTNTLDLFHNELKIRSSPWAFLREVNDVLEGVAASNLSAEQKNELMGQAYFWRAWLYYRLVTTYGGVPIIKTVQDAFLGDSGGSEIIVPRSTTSACIDFICQDLDQAASLLPSSWSETDFGHVTKGSALALKGRVLLFWASPLFNRADNSDRWQRAYDANLAAKTELENAGFGLAYESAPGTNAAGWNKMFLGNDAEARKEAVFVTLYNTIDETTNDALAFNNTWENSIRPKNTGGGGGKEVTAQMVDLFPMADGSRPTVANGYDKELFYVNRDPRFYRTFAFCGTYWTFDGTPLAYSPTSYTFPYDGKEYELWNYCWYDNSKTTSGGDPRVDSCYTGKATDGNGKGCVYLRKGSDDLGLGATATYVYSTTDGFRRSALPYMEIRFAEVLLNLAEAACGVNKNSEAIDLLKRIRTRAGITSTDCGLDVSTLTGDRAKLFEAILYERRVELCYEGKRYDDMRRWMLWDGGANQSTISPSWALTGFSGNTCTYLGVKPLKGMRRQGIEMRLQTTEAAEKTDGADKIKWPTMTAARPVALDVNSDGIQKTDPAMAALVTFHQTYLMRKTTRVDGDETYTIDWNPEYYFLGFTKSASAANLSLPGNKGWIDYNTGAMGTFDPLAE